MPILPGGRHGGCRRQRGGVGCQEGGPGGLHGCLPDVVPQLDVQGRRALAAWLGRREGALGQPCIKTTPFMSFYVTASKSFCLEKKKKNCGCILTCWSNCLTRNCPAFTIHLFAVLFHPFFTPSTRRMHKCMDRGLGALCGSIRNALTCNVCKDAQPVGGTGVWQAANSAAFLISTTVNLGLLLLESNYA